MGCGPGSSLRAVCEWSEGGAKGSAASGGTFCSYVEAEGWRGFLLLRPPKFYTKVVRKNHDSL